MPPRRKLSILDNGCALAWLNDGVRNCCKMIYVNLPLSKFTVDFIVCFFQHNVHVAVNSYTFGMSNAYCPITCKKKLTLLCSFMVTECVVKTHAMVKQGRDATVTVVNWCNQT